MEYKNLLTLLSKLKVKYKILCLSTMILFLFIIIYIFTSILFFCVNIWNKDVSKFTLNEYFPEKNRLKTYLLDIDNLPNISYPYIIKPTICSGTSRNVALIYNDKDLYNYIIKIKKDEKYIIQEFYKSKNEIGVLYEKIPYINDGHIVSIVQKKNDTNEWKPLKCGNIKNDENTQCSDLTKQLENSKFIDIIKKISSNLPGFNAGRYDIGFENIDELNKGNFKIYELNGVMGYDLRSNMTGNEEIMDIFLKMYYSIRWISVRYLIGLINIFSLKVSPSYILDKYPNSILNCVKCSDWEFLFQPCPT